MKIKIIWLAVLVAVLIGAFFYGGNYIKEDETVSSVKNEVILSDDNENDINKEPIKEEKKKEEEKIISSKEPEVKTDKQEESKTPEKETPVAEEVLGKNICTLTIKCDTILNNMNLLKENKKELVPENGIILDKITVAFFGGESVFNVLQRETKKHKIHFEFSSTPVFNSMYVEGIANLYEFDCGELSGWTYKVNGKSPGISSSDIMLRPGDNIEWLYTCDLGKDVNATVQLTKGE